MYKFCVPTILSGGKSLIAPFSDRSSFVLFYQSKSLAYYHRRDAVYIS